MTNNKKSSIRYIDDNTALVTKAFQKNASIFGTDEFKLWREYKAMFPGAKMTTKTIKKNPNKLNITKNMTYENMALYIRQQDDAVEVMVEFQKQIKLSKVKANPYRAVLVWGDRIFEKCGIGRDEGGDGGKTLEIRGKRRLPARDRGANYQQS